MHAHKKLLPCLYKNCCFSFSSLSSLTSHMSRYHPSEEGQTLKPSQALHCLHCSAVSFSVRALMTHLRVHVRQSEIVSCPVVDCHFKTNVLGTFWSHYSKKHAFLTYSSIKEEIRCPAAVDNSISSASGDIEQDASEHEHDLESDVAANAATADYSNEITPCDIDHELAVFFLKLETVYGISQAAIQDIICDLNRMNEMSLCFLKAKIGSLFENHDSTESLKKELFDVLQDGSTFAKLTDTNCLLSTRWRRDKFIYSNYVIVDPVEYCLGSVAGNRCTYVYVPFLDVLRNILKIPEVLKHVLDRPKIAAMEYRSYHSGTIFQNNALFGREMFSLQIGFYYDEFEIANPLGTSKGKYKISGFYWTIANLPPELRSAIDNIQLAVLCRYSHMQHFGINAVLGRFLEDVASLENNGIFVDSLGGEIRGSISFVAADNLAAHTLFGMTQSFGPSVDRFCRFCLATNEDALRTPCSDCSTFPMRTPTNYAHHVAQLSDGMANATTYGIRVDSVIHSHLTFFHATEGFPADVSHDLLEGVVPYEMALCVKKFIEKGYFNSITQINDILSAWKFTYTDSVNRPQPLSKNTLQRKTVGGNATENRTLLRLFPLMFGSHVPANEPCWDLILELKVLVELSFARALHEGDIVYFESKIRSHNILFNEIFPEESFKPKHHFISHYAQLTRSFGPLVQYSTLRFEAKHSFFKRVVRECRNFKNVCKMLAVRHQRLQCYLFASGSLFRRTEFVVKNGTLVPLTFWPPFFQLLQNFLPETKTALSVTNCIYHGIEYRTDLCVIDGFDGGLPTFCRIYAIAASGPKVVLLGISQASFYNEHMHSYEVEDTDIYHVHPISELKDYYPLPMYVVQSKKFVTLKHYVSWRLV